MFYRVPLRHEKTGQRRDVIVRLTGFQQFDAARQPRCMSCVVNAYAAGNAVRKSPEGFEYWGDGPIVALETIPHLRLVQ